MSKEAEADALKDEIAEVCGILNVATGRLVSLIARVLATESYAGAGIRSPEQWVAWKCGVSAGRARKLVTLARRLPALPECQSALAGGELSEDQVGVIVRHTPAHNDAEVATLARSATVAQLRRALGNYEFTRPGAGPDGQAETDAEPTAAPTPRPEPEADEPRRVNFGFDDHGAWRLSAVLPADEAALVERALAVARHRLFHGEADSSDAPKMVSWADALVAVAEACLATEAVARPFHDRHLVVLHVRADDGVGPNGHLHLGPALPDSLRRQLSCDGRGRVQIDAGSKPLSVGRTARIVPRRTRLAVEERDGACRVPGCERTAWLQIHHLVHWEDGGATDTANLAALCSRHHRLHHRGHLGITGDADDPDGLVFTDARGRRLRPSGRPAPPTSPAPTGRWVHPTGERLDLDWITFRRPPGAPPPVSPVPTGDDQAGSVDTPWEPGSFIDLDDPIYGATEEDFGYDRDPLPSAAAWAGFSALGRQ